MLFIVLFFLKENQILRKYSRALKFRLKQLCPEKFKKKKYEEKISGFFLFFRWRNQKFSKTGHKTLNVCVWD